MHQPVHRKVALVTGGSRGIGRAGGAAASFEADVSDPAAVAAMFAALDARFGRLDALVNNAGVGHAR